MLYLKKIRKGREQGFALEIVRLEAARGERVALVGPSGCGKSTALDLIAGVLRPDAGERFTFAPESGEGETDMLDLWRRGRREELAALRLRHMGYVLQTGGLLPFLSARDNILLGCGDSPLNVDAMKTLADELGIGRLLPQLPGTLSVGERQRVAIARALAGNPALVLADEPAAALDPVNAAGVMRLFTRLAEERSTTVVMVTHSPDIARDMGFRLVETVVEQQGDKVEARMGTA